MNRRDSKVQVALRQNDPLLEFENFKKKFLFANKQITKQNCSLSLKIEELNAHISSLYVENLRLRASEISLSAQLKRERQKCFKSMADAEAAVVNLLKHFGIIRETYNITSEPTSPSEPPSPPQKTRKPLARSPSAPRLAQLPSVPDIAEDPEPHETSSESEMHTNLQDFPEVSQKFHASASKLPQQSRTASPSAAGPVTDSSADESAGSSRKRKLVRRPSRIIPASDSSARPKSPTQVSTTEKGMDMSEEEEAAALKDIEYYVSRKEKRDEEAAIRKHKKKSRSRDDHDKESAVDNSDRKTNKGGDEISALRLKDVTNSPRRRRRAPAAVDPGNEAAQAKPTSFELPNVDEQTSVKSDVDRGYLLTPAPSSAASTPVISTSSLPNVEEDEGAGGRERRSRKSVNYSEPKLNTKMRRPDSLPSLGARSSSSTFTSTLGATAASSLPTPPPSQGKSIHQDAPVNEGGLALPEKSNRSSADASSRRSHTSSHNMKRRRIVNSLREDGDDDVDGDGDFETDDADADADAEFSEVHSWSNVSVRRKSGSQGVAKALNNGSQGETEAGLVRQHSNAH